jgi:acyl-CoA reductase-like NAD-dependent aldehyde dehydrogenase
MKPMIGAIAAGNAIIIKPSEVTENVSNVFAEKFKEFFTGDEISVVTGGIAETSELLKHKFDYIFYTGAPAVGKIIMRAASEHLTPVTLELGGKCPVYVDSEVDMEVAVSRISFGKWFNAGQTCVAPDYILCHQSKKDEFMKKMASKITQFFGENPQKSDDFGRVVSEKHMKRLEELIQNEKIYHGGKVIDMKDRYFEPTILDNPDIHSKVMKDEVKYFFSNVRFSDQFSQSLEFLIWMKESNLF